MGSLQKSFFFNAGTVKAGLFYKGDSMQSLLQISPHQSTQSFFIDFDQVRNIYLQETQNKRQRILFKKKVSEEAYWKHYYEMKDVCYEWCNGQLEEKPMADLASFYMYNWFLSLLNEYFRTFPQGTIVGLEIGFKMSLPHKTSIRKTDLALIHKSNPIQMHPDDRSYKGCFDMCFEFLSDSNISEVHRDTVVKKTEYEQANIKEYFILDRNHVHTAFYRLNNSGQYEEIPHNYDVIKSTVLPHFQFRYRDLFDLPSCEQLREDPVYMRYFQTDYNLVKFRSVEEKQRADKEKQRADEAISREKKLLQELAMLKAVSKNNNEEH